MKKHQELGHSQKTKGFTTQIHLLRINLVPLFLVRILTVIVKLFLLVGGARFECPQDILVGRDRVAGSRARGPLLVLTGRVVVVHAANTRANQNRHHPTNWALKTYMSSVVRCP
jgi:hypothetical protein